MVKEDWKVIVKTLRAFYFQSTFLSDIQAVQCWFMALQDLPTENVQKAVMEYVVSNKFPPTVADIRQLAIVTEIEDWSVGWGKVIKAIGSYGYPNEQKALESFDPVTRATVKRLGWRNICLSESIESDRANFRMIYQTIAEREKDGIKQIESNTDVYQKALP